MTLQEQVCSLEFARQLKQLGVEQESIVSWQLIHGWNAFPDKWEVRHYSDFRPSCDNDDDVCAAFTVAELGEMLPMVAIAQKGVSFKGWKGIYEEVEICRADTEADARAKMLIYLLENHLLELPLEPFALPA